MNLLFRRSQSNDPTGLTDTPSMPSIPFGFTKPRFRLWAKVELEPDEQAIVDHYHFDKAILIDTLQPDLLRIAAYLALGVFLTSSLIFYTMFNASLAFLLGMMAAGAAAYFYYDKKRESVFVKDLLHGRYFSCRSVIELARKEAWLETVTAFLRQVMESAKNWDGTETIKIEAMEKNAAKQFILKGL